MHASGAELIVFVDGDAFKVACKTKVQILGEVCVCFGRLYAWRFFATCGFLDPHALNGSKVRQILPQNVHFGFSK